MKKLLFSIALLASLGVSVLTITPTEIKAGGGLYDCIYMGGPNYLCPENDLRNCLCVDIPIYG